MLVRELESSGRMHRTGELLDTEDYIEGDQRDSERDELICGRDLECLLCHRRITLTIIICIGAIIQGIIVRQGTKSVQPDGTIIATICIYIFTDGWITRIQVIDIQNPVVVIIWIAAIAQTI